MSKKNAHRILLLFVLPAVCPELDGLLLKLQDPEKKKKSLVAEINNGRLAMMAIIGDWDPWGVDFQD